MSKSILCLFASFLSFSAFAQVIDLGGVKIDLPYLSGKEKECKVHEAHHYSCFFKTSNQSLVISVLDRGEEDDFGVYAKALKTKKVNLPLVSKPLENGSLKTGTRKWDFALHENAEIADHLTSYYLTTVKEKVLLLSLTSKDKKELQNFKTKHFTRIKLP